VRVIPRCSFIVTMVTITMVTVAAVTVIVATVAVVTVVHVIFGSDQSLKLSSQSKVSDVLSMKNVSSHVSERSSHLTGKCGKNF